MECPYHRLPILKICFSCRDLPVCQKCLDGPHYKHIIREFELIGPERKHSLEQHLKDLEWKADEMQQYMSDLDNLKEECRIKNSDAIYMVQKRGQDLKDAIDAHVKQLVLTCEQQQMDNENEITPLYAQAATEYEKIGSISQALSLARESKDVPTIVATEKEYREKKYTFKNFRLPQTNIIKFSHKQGTSQNLRHFFGSLEQVSKISHPRPSASEDDTKLEPKLLSSFPNTFLDYDSGVSAIAQHSVDDDCAWIKYEGERDLILVNAHGQMITRVHFDSQVADMTTTPEKRTLVTCPDKRCIQEILPNGEQKVLFTTDRLIPRAICISIEGNLLVSLVEKWSLSLTPSSVRKVVRLNIRGHRKEEAELDEHRQRLFIKPIKMVASHLSGDVAVINLTDHEKGHLVVLDTHLNLKFRYFGDGKVISTSKRYSGNVDSDFCPLDVIFDSQNRMVIGELYSGAVELLSTDGHFLKILHSDDDIPTSLAFNRENKIWIGYNTGKLSVIKFCEWVKC